MSVDDPTNDSGDSLQRLFYRYFLWINLGAFILFILYKLRNSYYCWLYSIVTPRAHKAIKRNKSALFGHLKDLVKGKTTGTSHLRILELGICMGNNFDEYPEGTYLTAIEPFTTIRPLFEENLQKAANVHLERNIAGYAEDMRDIEDETFDAVVCTYTLCSVSNVQKVLSEVERVLKPGGYLLFIEHIKSSRAWVRLIQYLWQPFHYFVAHFCVLVREPHRLLDESKFDIKICNVWDLPKAHFVVIKTHVEVLAVKKYKQ